MSVVTLVFMAFSVLNLNVAWFWFNCIGIRNNHIVLLNVMVDLLNLNVVFSKKCHLPCFFWPFVDFWPFFKIKKSWVLLILSQPNSTSTSTWVGSYMIMGRKFRNLLSQPNHTLTYFNLTVVREDKVISWTTTTPHYNF